MSIKFVAHRELEYPTVRLTHRVYRQVIRQPLEKSLYSLQNLENIYNA